MFKIHLRHFKRTWHQGLPPVPLKRTWSQGFPTTKTPWRLVYRSPLNHIGLSMNKYRCHLVRSFRLLPFQWKMDVCFVNFCILSPMAHSTLQHQNGFFCVEIRIHTPFYIPPFSFQNSNMNFVSYFFFYKNGTVQIDHFDISAKYLF